jgi:hypothetical protein
LGLVSFGTVTCTAMSAAVVNDMVRLCCQCYRFAPDCDSMVGQCTLLTMLLVH